MNIGSLVQLYFAFVVIGGILSTITWLVFWLIATLTCMYITNNKEKKLIIFSVDLILTILTFMLFFYSDGMLRDVPIDMILIYCFCIGAGSLLYELGLN
jgi:hypothetical protein